MTQPANPGSGTDQPVGGGAYEVRQGDCLLSIAHAHGLDWKAVWDHPNNAELKEQRGSPNVLFPGDRLFIPAPGRKHESCATEARHRFRRKGVPIEFELCVLDGDDPREGIHYVAEVENRRVEGTVPGDGVIKLSIRPSDRSGRLVLRPGPDQEEYDLAFGGLDPAHTPSGAASRLRNLGYLGTDRTPEALARALSKFQRRESLAVSGTLDDATARALTRAHGS